MALKNYFELTAMLRMQLPVLLSFAFMRCFMGYAAELWIKKCLPLTVQKPMVYIYNVASKAVTFLNIAMFMASLFYSSMFVTEWKKNAELERPRTDLICSEFACTRAQGLVCAVSLLTLFSRGEAFTLALAIVTLKGVTDGTVCVLPSTFFLLAATFDMHISKPWIFFSTVYFLHLNYAFGCYREEDDDTRGRIGASVLSVCFSSIFLLVSGFTYTVKCLRRRVHSALMRVLKLFHRLRGKVE